MKWSWKMWTALEDLFFPNVCLTCGRYEPLPGESVCLSCMAAFPYTNFHLQEENALTEIFWGRVHLQTATACFYFRKSGLVQELVHRLKYQGKKELGILVGQLLGAQLKQSSLYQDIDVILPVPLHRKKLLLRGYNQSTQFALGLSQVLDIPFREDLLIRQANTSTQTRKDRWARFENVATAFQVPSPAQLRNKSVLLVDDVITTGATLEACGQELLKVPGLKLYLATMAIAR